MMKTRIIVAVAMTVVWAAAARAGGPTPTLPKESVPEELSPEVREQILRLYLPKPEQRARAVRELGRLGSKAMPALPYVLSIVTDGSAVQLEAGEKIIDTSVAQQAREAVKAMGPEAGKTVLAAMKHKDPRIRAGAAHMLNVLRPPGTVAVLIAALADPSSQVRCAAAATLGRIRDKAAVEPLIELLKTEKDMFVISAAAFTLGHFKDPRAVEPLLDALARQIAARWSPVWTAWALGQLDDPQRRAFAKLTKLLKSDRPRVRGSAAYALGWLSDAAAVEPLLKAAADDSPLVRAYVADALGRLGDRRAVGVLTGLLTDADLIVRMHAVSGLEHLGDGSVVDLLSAMLKDPDVRIRRHAAGAIRTIWVPRPKPGSSRAPPKARAADKDGARANIDRMLRRGAVAAMVAALKDPDADVRSYAAEGLQRLAGNRKRASHEAWLIWQRDLEAAPAPATQAAENLDDAGKK